MNCHLEEMGAVDTLDADNQDEPSGLFLCLFEYTPSKDAKLQEIFNSIPKMHATRPAPLPHCCEGRNGIRELANMKKNHNRPPA